MQDGANQVADLAVALFDLMTLFLLTQTKAHNVPLYLLFRLQYSCLCTSTLPTPNPTQPTF